MSEVAALFQRLTHGVYVIGVGRGAEVNAFTAAWVMQVSFDPLLLALSINAGHASYRVLRQSRVFSVNVLPGERLDMAAHFGQPAAADKLGSTPWSPGETGVPLLLDAIAQFECRVVAEHEAGDHVLVLGQVCGGTLVDPAGEPLLYRDTGDMDGASRLFPDVLASAESS